MSLLKILLWGIVIYYIYKFLFGVVVPVGKAAGEMKSKINEIKKEQEEFIKQQQQQQQQTQATQNNNSNNQGEYIEFEEIKDKQQ